MFTNVYKPSDKEYNLSLNNTEIHFVSVLPNNDLSKPLTQLITECEQKTNLAVHIVYDEGRDARSVQCLKSDEAIFLVVPINVEIQDLALAHELMHMILFSEGYQYLQLNVNHQALHFVNNVLLDVVVNNRLMEYFEDDLKKSKRQIMTYNLKVLTDVKKEELIRQVGKINLYMQLITIFVHNELLTYESTNNMLKNKLSLHFPIVKKHANELIKLTKKQDISKQDEYSKAIEEFINGEFFDGELQYKWLNF